MMRPTSLLPAILLATACATAPSLSSQHVEVRRIRSVDAGATTESAYEVAKRQLALNNVGLAIDAFRKAARENPNSPDALNGLAVAYDRMGRYDLSRPAYEEALALAPSDPSILHNLQLSLIAQGRYSEATQLAAETGTTPIAVAQPRPVATTQTAPQPRNLKARLERVSLREVSLITDRSQSSPVRLADAQPAAERSRATLAVTRTHQASKKGMVEIGLPPASVTSPLVTVLNAAGRHGLARRTSHFLRERGWNKTIVGNARVRPDFSLLIHAPGDRLNAVLLAKTLPFRPRLVASAKARSMILLLGRNAAELQGPRRVSAT